ncbi:hypothetical protein BsWGS_23987 [Bradybaena similaris]
MNNKTPASVKIEQPEVYVDYPGEEIMDSESLLPSNDIKLETFYECDNVQSSTREIISKVQVFDKMGSKISVKIEPPEVYVDYADEDMKINTCSQSCPSLQEQPQMDKKMVFANIDWKHVKHELSDILCQKNSKMVVMAGCCSIPEITGNNTESRMSEDFSEDTTLIHHQKVSFIGIENGYIASQQHGNCSYLSKDVSSMAEIDSKICLTDENSQLHNVETPIKQTQISRKPLGDAPDNTCGSLQRIQAEATACMFDNSEITVNVDTFLHSHKTKDRGEKPYKCEVCSASFTQVGNLNCHKRTHTGEKPYKCHVCGASFTQAGHLKYHIRTHTGEKPYKCDVCGASFNYASHLKTHKITHTGEKAYMCDLCGASFTRVGSLKRHKITHTEEKPYKCDVCTASFVRDDHLKYHRRTHTQEKPYKCDVCATSFNRAGNLKRHKRTHSYRRETLHV